MRNALLAATALVIPVAVMAQQTTDPTAGISPQTSLAAVSPSGGSGAASSPVGNSNTSTSTAPTSATGATPNSTSGSPSSGSSTSSSPLFVSSGNPNGPTCQVPPAAASA